MWTVARLRRELEAGTATSRGLVEQALERIGSPGGEGPQAFIEVDAEGARAQADFSDRLRKAGVRRSAIDGLPVALKDLFDVAGQVTRAGSRLLADAPPAAVDAPAVARLRAAGAVLVGRTNMVEFAFGGVGLNPHYGTPRNPWDRGLGRVPGGSSSGCAVAQADGMSVMALGTDTRGSVRVPAAVCGLAGFKPTARRVPREGAFPLSYSLDSVGPLANSAACCAAYDEVLSAEPEAALAALEAKGLRLLVPRSTALEELDPAVASAFERALEAFSRAGARVLERPVPAFDRQPEYFKGGGLAGAESYEVHRPRLGRLGEFDPRVARRIVLGRDLSAPEYVEIVRLREAFIDELGRALAPVDALLMPTVPCVAPSIAEAEESDEAYFRWNARMLRNTGLINFLDGCALTLPCHEPGDAPVGLSICGPAMSDRRILAVGAALEPLLPARA